MLAGRVFLAFAATASAGFFRIFRPSSTKSVKKLDTFHSKKHFLHFFLRWCLRERLTSQRKNEETDNETLSSL